MDESYELVSKSFLKELKDENKRLKIELGTKPKVQTQKQDNSLAETIVNLMKKEAEVERKFIRKELIDIKELNKSTLDSVLTKTENLDSRLEGVVDTMKGLVTSLSSLIEEVGSPKEHHDTPQDMSIMIAEIKASLAEIQAPQDMTSEKILQQLSSIELFMQNLRILLSYVKPADLKVNPSAPANDLTPPPMG